MADRRIAVEKELAALGEAKKGANDIFRHCRGFERAYSNMLQVGVQGWGVRVGTLSERPSVAPLVCCWTTTTPADIGMWVLLAPLLTPLLLPPPLLPPQEAATAFKIRAVVEGTLPESLHNIPIEKRFSKAYVREVGS